MRVVRIFLALAFAACVVAVLDRIAHGAVPSPTDPPCSRLSIEVNDASICRARGFAQTPCLVVCGRLCYRAGRQEWRWMQGKDGCPRFPMPTPTPAPLACNPPACRTWGTGVCVIPCPYQTPSPAPSRTMSLLPTPTPVGKTPCDRGEPGWCLTWHPESDTVLCARCSR